MYNTQLTQNGIEVTNDVSNEFDGTLVSKLLRDLRTETDKRISMRMIVNGFVIVSFTEPLTEREHALVAEWVGWFNEGMLAA